jgi:hypothetical protein
MSASGLTAHDSNVLEKIKDPESSPSVPLLLDSSLSRDPHITDFAEYQYVASLEREIILEYMDLEKRIMASNDPAEPSKSSIVTDYDTCTTKLQDLITRYPTYASAYNNHAQALRRKFGESILLQTSQPLPGLVSTASTDPEELNKEARIILHDLDTAITLLKPRTPYDPISPQAAKTLAQAYTQRGVLYHITAKHMTNTDPDARVRIGQTWTVHDLEEMASRDFTLGGRFGNGLAKALAVATNPTAKLCGSIVREAMKKEFGVVA